MANSDNKKELNVQSKKQHERQQLQAKQSEGGMQTVGGVTNEPHPFLGRELRVELVDRRIIVGTLVAYLGLGDLLLQNALEQRCYADGEVSMRSLSLLAVPFKHVTAMHRRLPDCPPLVSAEF